MKFEELKEIWNRETIEDTTLNLSLDTKKNYHNAVKKLRQSMKAEFIATWLFLIGTIFFIGNTSFLKNAYFMYFYIMINLAVISTIYYHILFYRFYKNNLIKEMNTFQNLIEFSAEFRMNLHLYRSYNYLIAILIAPILIAVKFNHLFQSSNPSSTHQINIAILFMVVFIVLVVLICELWIYFYYRKYYIEIDKIKNQLLD